MGYTRKVKNTLDMNKFKADLTKEILDKVNAKDFVFAKKMKYKGYSAKDTCMVCNITEEEYNQL